MREVEGGICKSVIKNGRLSAKLLNLSAPLGSTSCSPDPSYSNRTGPAVRPVKYRIGAFTGPVHLRGSECNRTGKNRLNRPVFRSNQ